MSHTSRKEEGPYLLLVVRVVESVDATVLCPGLRGVFPSRTCTTDADPSDFDEHFVL